MKNRRKAKESAKKQVQNVVNGLKKDGKVIANDIKVVHQNQRRAFNNTIRPLPQSCPKTSPSSATGSDKSY
ncbi:hypothetical protein ACLUV9_10615 [Limosilactobacillus balticus]|uniref:hypothetical protein n=1 Tax=Limosilactobacillus balticus TaxID=2759747 RepID=UPI0039950734